MSDMGEKRAIVAIVGFASTIFFEPFVLLTLWRWFAVTLGAPSIGYWHIAGLNVLVGVFTWRYIPRDSDYETRVKVVGEHISICLFALMLGWLFSFGVAS